MKSSKQKAVETAEFFRRCIHKQPKIGLLTGTGLGTSVEPLEISSSFEYKDIPYFPVSTVGGHKGKLLFGGMAGREIIAMQGRFHLYEGYSSREVSFPVRVMQELGVKILIISNASGGLNLSFNVRDIMIISDHINLTGFNPLIGQNEENWGIRFPDMIQAYDKKLIESVESIGKDIGVVLKRGVYVGLTGPSLETPAEMRFLRAIGADAVGFSTIPEVIASVHGGMRVLGLSVVTNIQNPDQPQRVPLEAVIEAAKTVAPILGRIIKKVVENIDESELC